MNRIFTVVLFLGSSLLAQTVKPAVPEPIKVPEQRTTSGPKGIVLTPIPIVYGGAKIPGDSEVLATFGDLNASNNDYNKELEALNEKYKPYWEAQSKKMEDAIQRVKVANKWGDDVVFNAQTRQWVKLDHSEVEAMKKAQPASKITQ